MSNRNAKISAIFNAKSDIASSIEYQIESCKSSIESMKKDCIDENGNISMPDWTKETLAIYEIKLEIWENLLKQI